VSAYLVFNYSITNPEGYQAYPAAAMPSIGTSGAEVLVADYAAEGIEGSPGHVTVVLRFESKDAARAWYESEAYQSVKHLRTNNAEGLTVLCDGFAMPT
jgi:uncharacterized protein (DUF1330 family)